MYAKYYIHKQYIQSKQVSLTNFINFYKQIMLIEKERYTERDEPKTFTKRFKQNQLLIEL